MSSTRVGCAVFELFSASVGGHLTIKPFGPFVEMSNQAMISSNETFGFNAGFVSGDTQDWKVQEFVSKVHDFIEDNGP